MDGLQLMENTIKIHDLGVPLFLETPTWMVDFITLNLGTWYKYTHFDMC